MVINCEITMYFLHLENKYYNQYVSEMLYWIQCNIQKLVAYGVIVVLLQ